MELCWLFSAKQANQTECESAPAATGAGGAGRCEIEFEIELNLSDAGQEKWFHSGGTNGGWVFPMESS